ncbi:hypothetical protein Rt10032_c12g4855 [Rhodotorula toruloides]|uniref:Proteophosphoglycan ppg4 n=1 Tax=Rhodotorula toruloides TaxID=5286 RepID=A0A511KKD1_RHOTO|nr:hypothetical protein Rt10032_c12g4855 [Rhodotorula toruloides]
MSLNDTSSLHDGDLPTYSAPQSFADIVIVQLILCGVFLTLFVLYALLGERKKHSRDGQAALSASCVLNVVVTAFVFYESYLTAVLQDRSSFVLENGDLTWNVLPMLIGIITTITEGFLSARAGQLIASRLIRFLFWAWLGVLIALMLVGSAVTCADEVFYYDGATADDLVIKYSTGNSIYFWASCVADISISIACAWSLRARIAGFNPATESLLRHLISIAFRTAAYTAHFSLVSAILATVYNDNTLNSYVVYCFWMFMPAAYGLSLFTFATSSKRALEQRLGSRGSHGNVGRSDREASDDIQDVGLARRGAHTARDDPPPSKPAAPNPRPARTGGLGGSQHNEDRESSKGGSEKHRGPEWEV